MRPKTSIQTARRDPIAAGAGAGAGDEEVGGEEREEYSFCAAPKDSRDRKRRKCRRARLSLVRSPKSTARAAAASGGLPAGDDDDAGTKASRKSRHSRGRVYEARICAMDWRRRKIRSSPALVRAC